MLPIGEGFPLQILSSECRRPVHRCADADVVGSVPAFALSRSRKVDKALTFRLTVAER